MLFTLKKLTNNSLKQISFKNSNKKFSIQSLVDAPNKVKSKQELFNSKPHLHGAENPTYLKGPTDKTTVAIGAFLASIGMLQLIRGAYNMSWGVGKNE